MPRRAVRPPLPALLAALLALPQLGPCPAAAFPPPADAWPDSPPSGPRPHRTVAIGYGWPDEARLAYGFFPLRGWQLSFHADIQFGEVAGADAFSGLGARLGKIWFEDGTDSPLENSEYFFAGLNLHHNYLEEFRARSLLGWAGPAGRVAGRLRPQGVLGLGKNWKPFANVPAGLDLTVEISRVFLGSLRPQEDLYEVRSTRLRLGVNAFYLLGK